MKKNVLGFFCLILSDGMFASDTRTGAKPFTLAYDRTFASPESYKKPAQAWFDKNLATASKTDLLLALNLVYTSWARSQANLIAQERLESAQSGLDDMTHAFALTRLTPGLYVSKNTNNTPANNTALNTDVNPAAGAGYDGADLAQALEYHKNISRAHHYALEYIIDKKHIGSSAALAGLVLMRREARDAVAHALATMPRRIGDIVGEAHAQLSDVIEKFSHQKLIDLGRERGAVDFLWKYIQRFFARAFVKSDRAYANGLYASRQALLLSQSVYDALWRVMEEVRCAFYRAHYDVIYAALHKNAISQDISPEDFCILFDANGYVPHCSRNLPPPHSLSASFALS